MAVLGDVVVEYSIIGLDKLSGTISVKYFSTGYPVGFVYDLTLPIDPVTNTTLSGQALNDFIMFNAPTAQIIAAIEKVQLTSGVDFSHIEAIVEIPVRPDVPEPLLADGSQLGPLADLIKTSRL